MLFLSCSPDCQTKTIKKPEWITQYEDYYVDTFASYNLVKDYIYFDESYSPQILDVCRLYNSQSSNIDKLYSKIRYISGDSNHDNIKIVLESIKDEINKCRKNDFYSQSKNWLSNIDNVLKELKNNSNVKDFNDVRSSLKNLYNSTSQKNLSGNNNVNRVITVRNNSDFSANFALKDINNFNNSESEYQVIQPHCIGTFQLSWSANWNMSNNSDLQSDIIVLQQKQLIRFTRRVDRLVMKDTMVNNCECDIDALKARYKAIQDVFAKIKNEKLIKAE